MTDQQLTTSDLEALRRPFAFEDHEFKQKYAYVAEEQVCARIEETDPCWSFELLGTFTSGDNCVVNARMTIKGVSRDGVGMQSLKNTASEAEKGAATDALRRCARLFGIGRYLLGAPEGEQAFKAWLAKLAGTPVPAPQSRPTPPAQTSVKVTPIKSDDLRDKDVAYAFITYWRGKSINDGDVLAALGVSKLSEWAKGRKAADAAVDKWLDDRLTEEAS